MGYTINEYIKYLRENEGLRWQAVANQVSDKFNQHLTKNAVRKRYAYARQNPSERVDVYEPVVKEQKKLPQRYNEITELNLKGNIVVIGDTHIEFAKDGYLEFIQRTRDKYRCEHVIHIGDVVDNGSISNWGSDPDGRSAGDEMSRTYNELQQWYKAFPDVHVCIGNHDNRNYRKAFGAGLPTRFMKSYEEVWECPDGWKWGLGWKVDDVIYTHGTATGKNAGFNMAQALMTSVVIGHTHSHPGVQFMTNALGKVIYGLNVGCGIDGDAYAFAYSKGHRYKPTLGCGVVLDSGKHPVFVPFS